jgi:hypothetical protein
VLRLFFYPEDGGSEIFLNVGGLPADYMACYTTSYTFAFDRFTKVVVNTDQFVPNE